MKVPASALLPLSIVIVAGLTAAVSSPCLRCFFFSEDIVQYWLASLRIGQPQLIAEIFTRPWFQCSNMGLFYRPLVDLSYISDSLLYNGKVAFYHLTNLSCHVVSSVMCLLITRLLALRTGSTGDITTATATGLLAGLLFGLNPLQLEPVYWLCCRCDALCTMFTLVSFYLALLAGERAKSERSTRPLVALSVVAWLLALFAKEQAALLPFVLITFELMYPSRAGSTEATEDGEGQAAPLKRSRLREAIIDVMPYLFFLAVYTLLRFAVLGGIGGYHGTTGALLNETLLGRFTSPATWSGLLYPVDQEGFANMRWGPMFYSITYFFMALTSYGAWKANTFDGRKFKLVRFLLISALIVQVAAYQSFIVTESLFGSRCLYMAQAFACMALAFLFMCFRPVLGRNFLLAFYLLILAFTHTVNSGCWVARSDNLRAFQRGINQWAASAPEGKKFCLLNMPLDTREWSSLYDLEQLRCLLKPPVNQADNWQRAVQPSYLRMVADCVNKARIVALSNNPQVDIGISSAALKIPFALLDKEQLKKHFDAVNQTVPFKPAKRPDDVPDDRATAGYELDLSHIYLPQRADVIEVTVAPKAGGERKSNPGTDQTDAKSSDPAMTEKTDASNVIARSVPMLRHPKGSRAVVLFWYTDFSPLEPYLNWRQARFIDDGRERTYVFPLADRISWKHCGNVFHVVFGGLPLRYKITEIRLRDEAPYVPTLDASGTSIEAADNTLADGFMPVNEKQKVRLTWDASKVAGGKDCMLQISLADFDYSLHAGGFREFEPEKHSSKTIKTGSLTGFLELSRRDFPQIGKYQARLAATDESGKVVGFFSDPIDLMVTDKPLAGVLEKAVFNLRAQRQH